MPRKPAADLPVIARNLLALRTAAKLRQEDVAEIIGVKQAQYSKWETGRDMPRVDNLAALALALNASADAIVKGLARLVNGHVQLIGGRASPDARSVKRRRTGS